jgi:uncharacterized protein YndB with AHSA1/START domain
MAEFRGEQTVVIQAPDEMVYQYVSDLARHVEWNYQPTSVVKLTEGPAAVGTIYRTKERPPRDTSRLMRMLFPWIGKLLGTTGYTEAEITALEPNTRVAWTARAPLKKGGEAVRAEWELRLEGDGRRTRVSQHVYFQFLHKMGERMDAVKLAEQAGEEMAANLAQLKAILEPQAQQQVAGGRVALA